MKKLLSLVICLIMAAQCATFVLAADFTDVKPEDYFASAVEWAVENNITAGKTETTFAPNETCTRAQAVSFIWRAKGSPEPAGTQNPFTDVKESHYFYKAVLWAVENGITAGMTPTTFAPNQNCTRGQIVTFLWNTEGKPVVSAENPFTDVKESHYFYNAVLWAVENNITAGMSADKFAPNNKCTRGQIVCFLERCYKNVLEIVTQPADFYMEYSEVDATFTIEIQGGKPNYYYDWYVEGEKKATHGATDATSDSFTYHVTDYDFDNVQGSYLDVVCYVTDITGKQVASQTAKLFAKEVTKPLAFKVDPVDYQMTSSMEDATFTVEITGGVPNYYYDWYIYKDNDETKVSHGATSATSDTLSFSVSDYDFDDYREISVRCVVTDIEGNSIGSAWAHVLPKETFKPLAFKLDPVDYQMTSSMEEATFTVEIEGGMPNYYYDWYIYKDNDETKVSHGATSATSDTLTFVVSDYDFDDYREISVRCIVTDVEGNSIGSAWAHVLQK